MANLSWKSSTLLGTVLVVALGLQVGAVKLLTNRNRPADTAAAATTPARAPLDKPATTATTSSERPVVTDPPPSEAALLTLAQQPPAVTTSEPPPPAATASSAATTTHSEASPEARLATTAAPASHSAARPAVAPKNPPPPTATASVEAAPRPTPASPASAPAVATAPVPAVTPSAEAATIKPDDAAASDGLRDAAWLKTRDPKNYTVQLYSGKDLNKLKEVAAETTSNAPQAYFTTGSRNSPWYSLVVGDYPDSAAARAAAAAIAAQSVQLKPWVRRLDEIQATMR